MSEEEIKSVEDNNDNINYVKDMVDSYLKETILVRESI